ncbi:ExbD/TolR family protein [Nannocystaceae bacterium ST9]
MSIVTSSGGADGEEPMAAINVTSLIDVMFVLLVAFMAAVPAATATPAETLDIDVPHSRGVEITAEQFEYSVISIDAQGRVFVGMLPLDAQKERWSEQLAANSKLKKDGMAFIQGDRNVPFEKVLDVMLALQQAGVSEVGFVTDPKIEK